MIRRGSSNAPFELYSAALCLLMVAFGALQPAYAVDLKVTRGDFASHFLLTGELVAEDAALLVVPNANVWPVTVRWLEEDGAEVKEGDSLVEFDNSQLASNLEEMERSAIEAGNQLASLRAVVRGEEIEAELRYARSKADLEKGALDANVPASLLSQQDFEERKLAHERAQLEFEQAESALALSRESARARIEKQRVALLKSERAAQRAREGITLLTLTAPRDGILLVSDNDREGRPFQTGDSTWPGLTIARLPELTSMIVEAWLFDVDDGAIRPGMPVRAVVDAFPALELAGEVFEVDDIANETNGRSLRRVFRTRVHLDGLDLDRMRPGMSVKVVVEDRRADVLQVPRIALGWTQSETGGTVVVSRSDGELQRIEIGPCNRETCVLESGLTVGDRLSEYSSPAFFRRAGGSQ